jgi:hypothetical protein
VLEKDPNKEYRQENVPKGCSPSEAKFSSTNENEFPLTGSERTEQSF